MDKNIEKLTKKVRCGYCAAQVIVGDWIIIGISFLCMAMQPLQNARRNSFIEKTIWLQT